MMKVAESIFNRLVTLLAQYVLSITDLVDQFRNSNGNGKKDLGSSKYRLFFRDGCIYKTNTQGRDQQFSDHFLNSLDCTFPYLPVDNYSINPLAIRLVPVEIVVKNILIPVEKINNILTIAIADPSNKRAIEEVESVSKCHVRLCIATPEEIMRAIKKYYSSHRERKHDRIDVNMTIDMIAHNETRHEFALQNISTRGIAGLTIYPCAVDEKAEFILACPFFEQPIKKQARVVWRKALNERLWGVGFDFGLDNEIDLSSFLNFQAQRSF